MCRKQLPQNTATSHQKDVRGLGLKVYIHKVSHHTSPLSCNDTWVSLDPKFKRYWTAGLCIAGPGAKGAKRAIGFKTMPTGVLVTMFARQDLSAAMREGT